METLILSPSLSQARAIAQCFVAGGAGERVCFGEVTSHGLYASVGEAHFPICDDWRSRYDSVIPTGSCDTAFMLRRFETVRLGQVSMEHSSLRWLDKPWSLAFAESVGVSIPRTWSEAAEVPPDIGPVFYKPGSEGVWGDRTWVETPMELPNSVTRPGSGFIFQEKIEGRDVYSFGFLADRGKIIVGIGLAERVSCPPDGGSAAVMELFDDARLAATAQRLISESNYSGWGLVEFKFCPRRETYVFMEVNPKFWASIELVLRTQPMFARLLFGLDVPAERIIKLWWPGRFARMGIDNWPHHMLHVKDATVAQEPFALRDIALGLLPYRLQRELAALKRCVVDLYGNRLSETGEKP